ncbi:hypothetical protein SAY86_014241 [Trapa natans]|uniref:Uncharacterized protein n=1 Tax=Trapa natans TaxID=22666 RepID=A0AAN7KSS8_TRANT|nr:hypothetical protein SAY86_014241 [Trapa natans]
MFYDSSKTTQYAGPRSSGIYSSIELASPLSLKSHFTSVPHDESIAVLRSPSCGGAVFCIACAALRFDLQSGHTKCIAEDIKGNSMTVGKYSIVNPTEGHPLPESHKLTVRVMEFELKQLQETITSIHEEMLYLRER